jgi:hypothetical protein
MALNSELVDRVMLRLGTRTNAALRTGIVSEVNAQIEILERASFLPWFLEDNSVTVTTVADQDWIAAPARFLREIEEDEPWFTDADDGRRFLVKREPTQIQRANDPDSTDYPQVYAVRGDNTILFGPIPDDAYTITFPCYRKSNVVFVDDGAAVTHPWLLDAADWVLNLAGAVVADLHLQNTSLSQRLGAYAGAARSEVWKHHTARLMANFEDTADKFAGERTG